MVNLSKSSIAFAVLATAVTSIPAHAEDKTLEKRVEELEFASYKSTFSWTGFFESRYDSLKYKPEGGEEESYNFNRMLGGIDFSASPAERLSVFGRVTFGKFYNNQNRAANDTGTSTLSGSRRYGDDGTAKIERFFINYKILSDLTVSLGRLPTLDGPPMHIYDGRARLGSYPAQLYSSALDGYALTYAPKIDENQSIAFRYIVSPFSNIGPSSATSGQWKYYDKQTVTGGTELQDDVREISSWMADYAITGTSIARNINLIYQGLSFTKLAVTDTLAFSFKRHTAYLELSEIANMGLSFYASHSWTSTESTGSQIVGVNPATGTPIVAAILSNKPDDTAKGTGLITGFNYKIPAPGLMNPMFGVEYIKGSEKYNNFDFSSDSPFGYYDIRGTAQQIYYTQPLATGLSLRVGYQAAKGDHTAGLVGAPREVKDEVTSLYAKVRADF